jgi:GT2 family glycosyltransferase
VFANAFTARHVVDAVGAMNPDFLSSGEIEWGHRVGRAGYRAVFAPDAVVRHPARTSVHQLCRRALRLEHAWSQLRETAGLGRGARHWLGQYLFHPMRSTYRDVVRNPALTALQRMQVTALSLFLILYRIAGYALVRMGVRFDPRRKWG